MTKDDYLEYLLHHAKHEHVVELVRDMNENYNPKITTFNCDRLIQHGMYSDGAPNVEVDLLGDTLIEAIRSGMEFGNCLMESEWVSESPNPGLPLIKVLTTAVIPVKEVE